VHVTSSPLDLMNHPMLPHATYRTSRYSVPAMKDGEERIGTSISIYRSRSTVHYYQLTDMSLLGIIQCNVFCYRCIHLF